MSAKSTHKGIEFAIEKGRYINKHKLLSAIYDFCVQWNADCFVTKFFIQYDEKFFVSFSIKKVLKVGIFNLLLNSCLFSFIKHAKHDFYEYFCNISPSP